MKDQWLKARKEVGNIDLVIGLVRKSDISDLRRGRKGMAYPFDLDGTQHRKSIRGEGEIEVKLLSPKKCVFIGDGWAKKEVEFMKNAAGLGNRRKDNIITDLFGLDEIGSPVAGEVKISDRNPWYAVVECVAQIALMRSDRKNLREWLKKKLGDKVRGRGAWGIVIAQEKYWKKKEAMAAKLLVEELRSKTKIRVGCVCYSKITNFDSDKIQLKVVFGKPPSTRRVK